MCSSATFREPLRSPPLPPPRQGGLRPAVLSIETNSYISVNGRPRFRIPFRRPSSAKQKEPHESHSFSSVDKLFHFAVFGAFRGLGGSRGAASGGEAVNNERSELIAYKGSVFIKFHRKWKTRENRKRTEPGKRNINHLHGIGARMLFNKKLPEDLFFLAAVGFALVPGRGCLRHRVSLYVYWL